MKKYFWTGISREERTKTLHELTPLISRFGTVMNFLRYSDLALGITIETEEKELPAFYAQLQTILTMDGFDGKSVDSTALVYVYMHISFLSGTGDLLIENIQFTE